MASKRKSNIPERVTGAKRRCVSWCFSFRGKDNKIGNGKVRNDDEILELEDYNNSLLESVPTKSPRKYPKKQKIDDNSSKIIKNCSFYVTIFKDVSTNVRTLGEFYVWPTETSESLNDLFYFLIKLSTKFWIYVDEKSNMQYAFLQFNDVFSNKNTIKDSNEKTYLNKNSNNNETDYEEKNTTNISAHEDIIASTSANNTNCESIGINNNNSNSKNGMNDLKNEFKIKSDRQLRNLSTTATVSI